MGGSEATPESAKSKKGKVADVVGEQPTPSARVLFRGSSCHASYQRKLVQNILSFAVICRRSFSFFSFGSRYLGGDIKRTVLDVRTRVLMT